MRSSWRSKTSEGDAECWAYDFRHPLGTALLVLAPGPQEFAVTTAHQREAALHQANCSIAQIMGLPGAIGDAFFAEQRFGDSAITAAGAMRIERADRGAEAFAPVFR